MHVKKDSKGLFFLSLPFTLFLSLHFTHTLLTFTPPLDDTFDDDKIFSSIDM
jgi:hypothetical protein